MEDEKEDHGKSQAEAQLASIHEMVKRLRHCEGCELDPDTGHRIDRYSEDVCTFNADYHDIDAAQTRIQEDPLSVTVRSAWESVGESLKAAEYQILLCWGGPACRVVGDLDEYGQPDNARIEYQDWGTPWTVLDSLDENLIAYAHCFYYGE